MSFVSGIFARLTPPGARRYVQLSAGLEHIEDILVDIERRLDAAGSVAIVA